MPRIARIIGGVALCAAALACNVAFAASHREAPLIASSGTYDQKHFARIAGVEHCVAYGPGVLELAHQPDEWCSVEDLVNSTKVIALTALDLLGGS